jgi:hypothetical protein
MEESELFMIPHVCEMPDDADIKGKSGVARIEIVRSVKTEPSDWADPESPEHKRRKED